jgi:hypothetical protein
MKMALICLRQNERFVVHMPLPFFTHLLNKLFRRIGERYDYMQEKYGTTVNIHTVNALRNKVALKNAFMQYVVRDSLGWANDAIKQEMGKFQKCTFVVKEYLEEVEFIKPEEEGEIKEQKPEPAPESKPEEQKEENIKVTRTFQNPDNEAFVNQPVHKEHLSSNEVH